MKQFWNGPDRLLTPLKLKLFSAPAQCFATSVSHFASCASPRLFIPQRICCYAYGWESAPTNQPTKQPAESQQKTQPHPQPNLTQITWRNTQLNDRNSSIISWSRRFFQSRKGNFFLGQLTFQLRPTIFFNLVSEEKHPEGVEELENPIEVTGSWCLSQFKSKNAKALKSLWWQLDQYWD